MVKIQCNKWLLELIEMLPEEERRKKEEERRKKETGAIQDLAVTLSRTGLVSHRQR